jgi:hypothetical protein
MNWFPVEYEGTLTWDDHSTVFDNDYSWDILSKNNDLALASGSNNNRTAVHIEFDSVETVNDWDGTNTWWDHFHHDVVDRRDKTAIRSWFGSKFAIVIGMLGLDLAESDHHSELHPVYAMFIRMPGEPAGVHWAFFVRNWGNEGYCGPDDQPIPNTQIRVRIPDQELVAKNVFGYAHGSDECNLQDPTIQSTTQGALLTFDLPPASKTKKCGFVGDLWMMPGRTVPVSAGFAGAFEDEDPVLGAKIARLDPSARRQLDEQLSFVMNPPRSGTTVWQMDLIRKPRAHFERPPVAPALPNYGEGLKSVPNTAFESQLEKKRRFIDAFLKAHGID